MKHRICLEVGDRYDDGHGKWDQFRFESNFDSTQIATAYRKGCEILGFDLINDYCQDYEDNLIPATEHQKLIKNGIDFFDRHSADGDGLAGPKAWANTYMAIAKLGDRNLEYISLNKSDFVIDIEGYGLYY